MKAQARRATTRDAARLRLRHKKMKGTNPEHAVGRSQLIKPKSPLRKEGVQSPIIAFDSYYWSKQITNAEK